MPWGPSDSLQDAFVITPAATVFPGRSTTGAGGPQETRAVYVGGTGDLTVTMSSGVSRTYVNVQGGTLLPIQIKACTAATATSILGCY